MVFFTFFTLAVCEASLGLSLLIKTVRKTGQPFLSSLNLKLKKLATFKVANTIAQISIIIIFNFQLKD